MKIILRRLHFFIILHLTKIYLSLNKNFFLFQTINHFIILLDKKSRCIFKIKFCFNKPSFLVHDFLEQNIDKKGCFYLIQ